MKREEELLKEIKEIIAQYKDEVPGGRRPWPRSIKNRVLDLYRLGMRGNAIARETGIPYHSVLKWKSRSGEFREVKALSAPEVPTVTVPTFGTISMTTRKGVKVEGLSREDLVFVLERMR